MAAPRKYSDELRERATRMAIELLPGAGDELLRLGPLIRPLNEVHWTKMVAEINGVASAELDLHRHLFGSDPILPPRPLRDGLAALRVLARGGPVEEIARLARHASSRTTEVIYRRELRPVITTRTEVMDQIFRPKREPEAAPIATGR